MAIPPPTYVMPPDPYGYLRAVLMRAYEQAAAGKGKERHAVDDTRFEDQPMGLISKQIGSIDGLIYQAHKKSLEALRLPQGRNVAELLGAINYLAGAVIALETWAAKPEVPAMTPEQEDDRRRALAEKTILLAGQTDRASLRTLLSAFGARLLGEVPLVKLAAFEECVDNLLLHTAPKPESV